jgi:hypothetical protein
MVEGASDDEKARVATPLAGSPGIPGLGNSHPLNKNLICTQLPVESRDNGYIRIVRAIYEMAISGTDPLAEPPIIRPNWGCTSETFDLDVEKKIPIFNGGGFPLPQGDPTRETYDLEIEIERKEPLYPLQKSINFKSTSNKGNFEIPDIGTISEGQGLCLPIRTPGFTSADEFVVCIYTIRVKKEGWRTRNKNIGMQGWYSSATGNKIGNFLGPNNSPPAQPLELLPNGIPIKDGYTVEGSAAIPNPGLSVPADIFEDGAGDVTFLRYHAYPLVDWTNLFLFDNKFHPFG